MRQVLLLTAFVLALAGVSPAAALAGPIVDRAVAGLAGGDFGGGDFGGGGDF